MKRNVDLKDLIDRLQMMEGKLFLIDGMHERILHVEFDQGKARIKTDRKMRELPQLKIGEFIDSCNEVEEGLISHTPQQTTLAVDRIVFSELKNVLMDNIKKIQQDKNYIPQAAAINDQAKSMIDLAKSEIELVKTMYHMRD